MNVQISPLQTPPTRGEALDNRESEGGSRTRTIAIGVFALVVLMGGFWYFTHSSAPAPRRNLAAPVRVAPVQVRNMAVIEHTIGTVMANASVQINARVAGQLTKAFFHEGQMVKTGDLLFQIDPRPYKAVYDNAVASVASAKAKAERYERLTTQNAIAAQSYDDAQAAYLEAEATAEAARLNLEYTEIRSPVNGKTGAILIQPGNMVTATTAANGNMATANPLVTINEIQPVKISLSLPQSDLPRIQAQLAKGKGLNIIMNVHDAGADEDITVPVNFVSNAVAGNTGTIELRATYANSDMALVPGQLVDVTVALAEIPEATVVPRESVNTGPDGQFVYVVKDGVAQQRFVKVLFDDGVNEAVQGQLVAGELVITEGQLRVLPNGKVNVTGQKKAAHGGEKGPKTSGRRHVQHAQDREG
jgi:multidrug efflux system membrane fusion protein